MNSGAWRGLVLTLVIAIAALVFYGARLAHSVSQWWPEPGAVDQVTRIDARFAKMRRDLPSRGIIGYRTRPAGEVATPLRERDDVIFLTAQYALAPLILDEERFHEYTILSSERGFGVLHQERP